MLMNLWSKFHLGRYPRIHTCQLSCQDTYFIQRRARFLSPDSHIPFPCRHICKTLRHNARGIIKIAQFFSIKIIKRRNCRKFLLRQCALFHLNLGKIGSICHAKPSIFRPFHFLDCSLTSKCTAKFRHKRSRTKMYQIHFPCRQFHITSMPWFLQNRIRIEIFWL